ncbi:hypothetical protein PHMEG_00028917 [Phytophthora megakarya]|uniref:Uncharacterized protein n=1 Tax=Phytophthora megakarya TaxID=4795 RepID=A0A225V6D7_9STRA|nr:hypothetical protein PHMEG_00028917 [Phytophthora megakarya]
MMHNFLFTKNIPNLGTGNDVRYLWLTIHTKNYASTKGLLNREQENDDAIKPQLDLLKRSRREYQFVALSNIIIENWRARGEGEYADVPSERLPTPKSLPSPQRKNEARNFPNPAVLFQRKLYVIKDENLYGLKVTKARTTKYAMSIDRIFHVDDKVEDIQLSWQSLHAVDVDHHRALSHDWVSPVWVDMEVIWHGYVWFMVAQITLLLVYMNTFRFDKFATGSTMYTSSLWCGLSNDAETFTS